ncbi:MAG: ATP-grasp domain-containing protein [Thermodesulfobacteriota bacterium]|nr:ATP-grasp domain-containing protein [Thermodesulfobacteriota bacterium]
MADNFLFSNFTYNPSSYYFLYVGDIKTYGLNFFLQDALVRNYRKKIEFIAIVPDILVQYNYQNLIVINPLIDEYQTQNGSKVSYRIDSTHFVRAVSENEGVRRLIENILAHQNHLFINMYESVPEMTLDEQFEQVDILGPEKNIAKRLNNKSVQYELLKDVVPVVDFRICMGRDTLLATADQLWQEWSGGIFVSNVYSAAGANSAITRCREDILHRFIDTEATFLATRYVPHEHDPTVLAVVANEEEVFIAGVADQVIRGGNRFVGSTYPTKQPVAVEQELKEYTRKVGQVLGREGYRGIFGCDYIVTPDREVRFIEVNARKQGTTLEFCFTLEQSLPETAPTLPELEYHAVVNRTFPFNTIELENNGKSIHWGTYNYKVVKRRCTRGYIPQNPYERDAFQKIAGGELLKDFVILEHVGSNYVIMPGTFLARVVSVARNHDDVKEGIRQGKEFIEMTIDWKSEY